MKSIKAKTLGRGALLGFLLFAAYTLQTLGLVETTPGKNAFLTAIYCILVPFLFWMVTKKRPDIYNCLAGVLCLGGIGLVSLTAGFSIGMGDALTMAGGIIYAMHIVVVGTGEPRRGPGAFDAYTVWRRCRLLLGIIPGHRNIPW